MGEKSKTRRAEVERTTRETSVAVHLDLDAASEPDIETGIGFLDHMLTTLATHGRFGIVVRAKGDLHVDQHHLVEDVGITLGQALREALGADLRVQRFAHAYAPLDEALARVVIDLSGRPSLQFEATLSRPVVGGMDSDLVREFFQGLVSNAGITLHVDLLRGRNTHHEVEAIFKATALALRDAVRLDPSLGTVPSTKGTLAEDDARGKTAP